MSASTPIGTSVPPLDIGASPELAGTNRSGKKRHLPVPQEETAPRRTKARKMVTRTPPRAGSQKANSPEDVRGTQRQNPGKSPPRDEEMTPSDLAAIMCEGMGKMLGGLTNLECQITGKIDSVKSDLRDTNTAVVNQEEQFKSTNDDNNRLFQQLERFMNGNPPLKTPYP